MPELEKGDEEQGEELLPVTETDDASLLGQTPQSTDGVLPPPPPYTPPLIQVPLPLTALGVSGGACVLLYTKYVLWVKLLLVILLAVPAGVWSWWQNSGRGSRFPRIRG